MTVSIMHKKKKKKRKEARETSAVKVGAIQPGMLSGHKFCQSLAVLVYQSGVIDTLSPSEITLHCSKSECTVITSTH